MSLDRWNPDAEDTRDATDTTHTCENCGAHVTPRYARVFAVDGAVECCPSCETKIRGGDGRPRQARSRGKAAARATGGGATVDD
jgi:hypothetical protein